MDVALAIFAYRRPEKLADLGQAIGSWTGPVCIFCDNDPGDDRVAVEATRGVAAVIANKHRGFVVERPYNYGLSRNLTEGISEVLRQHEAVIVLEDDIIVRDGALPFFLRALELVKDNKKIFSVSGYHPLEDFDGLPDLFLSRRFLCWGWATWADRWGKIESDIMQRRIPYRHYWDIPEYGGDDLKWAMRSHSMGRKPITWAQLVNLHCLARDWWHLCPKYLQIDNVGFDGSGEHCLNTASQPVFARHEGKLQWRWSAMSEPDPFIDQSIASMFRLSPVNHFTRLRRYLNYRLRRLLR